MRRQHRILAWALLLFLATMPGSAQVDQAAEPKQTLEELRAAHTRTEADPGLDDATRARALELYGTAIASLESAADAALRKVAFEKERDGIERQVASLRRELDKPERKPELGLPKDPTTERAEAELARERSRLSAHRSALEDAEQASEARDKLRDEAAQRLGALDQQIEQVSDELRSLAELGVHPEIQAAQRQELLARRAAAEAEIETVRARLDLLDKQASLTPWRIDLVQRRLEFSELRVEMLDRATRASRRAGARARLQEIQGLCKAAAAGSPLLADVAAETTALADTLWGPEGVEVRLERTLRSLSATRKNISDLDRISKLTRRQFEAIGQKASLVSWWPDVPEDFPELRDVEKVLVDIEQQIPEVQHDLMLFEQQRAESRGFSRDLLGRLSADEATEAELIRLARNLTTQRQELLDSLIQSYARYSTQLAELQRVSRRLFEDGESIEAFLYERLLWVRSVPRPVVPPVAEFTAAAAWMFSGENWRAVGSTALRSLWELPGKGIGLLVILGLLVAMRRTSRTRIAAIAEQMVDPEIGSFRGTLETLVHVAILAAPLPLALYLLGQSLSRPEAPIFVFAASEALLYLASIAGLLAVARQVFSREGLAVVHFGWSEQMSKPIRSSLIWPVYVFLPLIYIALHLGSAGIKLDSPDHLQAANNSLGRAAFIVGLFLLGGALLNAWRPSREDLFGRFGKGESLKRRLYLVSYPFIFLATIVPAILAASGYYITGYLLAYQMLRTLWVLVLAQLLGGLMFRWHRTARVVEEEVDGSTGEAKAGEAQVRTLFRFGVVLFIAFNLAAIWSEALPTLQLLKRVQLLPRVELLDAPSGAAAELAAAPAPAKSPEDNSGEALSIPGLPAPAGADSTANAEPTSLTLWQLVEAILAVLITTILVRNVPGLIELTLRRRTTLEAGTRVALSTLARYAILIFGISIAFGLLGISWSKIQWLAAALTFGLGFGLQEIVANFVSGLILLLERPVRVGDAVTVGNLQGVVTQIRIRATTITLWDRSEMIVPNKEFITTKLINWTLSDSQRRIDIPLRVAYHSDVQRVKETLLEVAGNHPAVLDDPPPSALLLEFGNEALCFELRFFVDFGMGLKTRDEVSTAIEAVFEERGIEFALPQLSIRVPGGVPRAPDA